MQSYSGMQPHEISIWKWGIGRNADQRRDDRLGHIGSMQSRIIGGGGRQMISPWENGIIPGTQPNLPTQNSFVQQPSNSYLVNSGLNRQTGGYSDQRVLNLRPSPAPSNTSLFGASPKSFRPTSRVPELKQQRIKPSFELTFPSGAPRELGSGYYPKDGGHQDKSRKFTKAKYPDSKPLSKGNSSRDGKGKSRNSTSQSPSVKGREDKEKNSSHSKELKSKQGGSSLAKPESSSDLEKEDSKNDLPKDEEEGKEQREDVENADMDEKDEQKENPFPKEALYCHICEIGSFSSKKIYFRHLFSANHTKTAELFHAKNAATLELIDISAKLSEMRRLGRSVHRRKKERSRPVHKTVEEMQAQKWLKIKSCCGKKFECPYDLENHKLSLQHLKVKHLVKMRKLKEEEEEQKMDLDKVKKNLEKEEVHKEVIRVCTMLKEVRKQSNKKPLTVQTLPTYDPASMIGLEFIKEELRFRCTICKSPLFKDLDHCYSYLHYSAVANYLHEIEIAKRLDIRNQKEAECDEIGEAMEEEKGDKDDTKDDAKDNEEDEELDGELLNEQYDKEEYDDEDDAKDNEEDEEMVGELLNEQVKSDDEIDHEIRSGEEKERL